VHTDLRTEGGDEVEPPVSVVRWKNGGFWTVDKFGDVSVAEVSRRDFGDPRSLKVLSA
jgi:hypothetical protein